MTKERVGEVFEPENPRQLADALLRLASDHETLAHYSAAGLAAAPRYDRANLAASMLDVLKQVAQPRREPIPTAQ